MQFRLECKMCLANHIIHVTQTQWMDSQSVFAYSRHAYVQCTLYTLRKCKYCFGMLITNFYGCEMRVCVCGLCIFDSLFNSSPSSFDRSLITLHRWINVLIKVRTTEWMNFRQFSNGFPNGAKEQIFWSSRSALSQFTSSRRCVPTGLFHFSILCVFVYLCNIQFSHENTTKELISIDAVNFTMVTTSLDCCFNGNRNVSTLLCCVCLHCNCQTLANQSVVFQQLTFVETKLPIRIGINCNSHVLLHWFTSWRPIRNYNDNNKTLCPK